MKETSKLSFQLFAAYWKRTLAFLCILALLSWTAGLLGEHFLTKKNALTPIAVAIVDEDLSPLSSLLMGMAIPAIEETDAISIQQIPKEQAEKQLKAGKLSAFFIIPKDFVSSVMNGENIPLQVAYNPYTPIQSSMIQMIIDQVLVLLRSSQSGIFAVLDYVDEHAPEQYNQVAEQINIRFISAIVQHKELMKRHTVSVTGSVSPFVHYLFAGVFFLLLLGCNLYVPILQKNFTNPIILQLQRQHLSSSKLITGWTIGWWAWYGILGILLFFAYRILSNHYQLPFSPLLLITLLLIFYLLACIGTFSATVFSHSTDSTLFLVIYSALSLFFSGGIIPPAYLSPFLEQLCKYFPSYWVVTCLENTILGNFSPFPFLGILGSILLFWGCSVLWLKFSSKGAQS